MAFDPADFDAADLIALWKRDPDKRGPALITIGADIEELPLCGFCPMARWYVREETLYAFCKEYRDIMYMGTGAGVTYCDAYVVNMGITDPAPEA